MKATVLESAAIMPRYLRFTLIVGALLVCSLQTRAQVTITFSAPCTDAGILAWGQVSPPMSSPVALQSNCAGTVQPMGLSNASGGEANQIAAFSAGRGVALEDVNWTSASPLMIGFPAEEILELKVWVLYTKSTCDFACVRLKMANFMVWANDRLTLERTGIRLKAAVDAAGSDADWVSNQTGFGSTSSLKAFSGGPNGDCKFVPTELAGLKKDKALNLYIVQTVMGSSHAGIYCKTALEGNFANAFVAWQASDSTKLHELSHNLGLTESDLPLNVMNDKVDGLLFSEGQSFWMNFSNGSAMTMMNIFARHSAKKRDCGDTRQCPTEDFLIWPDP